MNTVQVMFADRRWNYSTSVSGTLEECRAYFVGQWLNIGSYPEDIMQQCVDIAIQHPDNIQTASRQRPDKASRQGYSHRP